MKLRIRNKKLVFGILAVAIAFTMVASATVLNYYGKVETEANVKQSLRLDGKVFGSEDADITSDEDIGNLIGGSYQWGSCHKLHLHSAASNPVSTEVSSVVTPDDGGLTTMIAAEVQDAGLDCSDYTVPTADVTVDTISELQDNASKTTAQIIVVKDGTTYNGVVDVMTGHTIVAETYLGAEITGGFNIKSDDVTIKGFHIEVDEAFEGGHPKGIYLPSATGVTIECNEFEPATSGTTLGILTKKAAIYNNVVIQNNDFGDLTTGIYTNPHTGTIDILNNYFTGCTAGIGCANNANVQYNVFDWDGEALGIDDTFTSSTSGRNLVVQYNNFYGDASLNNYGTTGQNAPYNWWGCDGIDISAPVNAGWNTWDHGDIITLQPDETVHFMIQYCTLDNAVGDYNSTVKFIAN